MRPKRLKDKEYLARCKRVFRDRYIHDSDTIILNDICPYCNHNRIVVFYTKLDLHLETGNPMEEISDNDLAMEFCPFCCSEYYYSNPLCYKVKNNPMMNSLIRVWDNKIVHKLKCWSKFFQQTWNGNKNFELRWNDRGYAINDELILSEYFPKSKIYSERKISVSITSILKDNCLLKKGVVCLGIKINYKVFYKDNGMMVVIF